MQFFLFNAYMPAYFYNFNAYMVGSFDILTDIFQRRTPLQLARPRGNSQNRAARPSAKKGRPSDGCYRNGARREIAATRQSVATPFSFRAHFYHHGRTLLARTRDNSRNRAAHFNAKKRTPIGRPFFGAEDEIRTRATVFPYYSLSRGAP